MKPLSNESTDALRADHQKHEDGVDGCPDEMPARNTISWRALGQVARLTTLSATADAVAHEINQPLTVIATQAQAFSRRIGLGQATDDEIAKGLDLITEQALRAAQILKRIRAFVASRSRVQNNLQPNELIEQALMLVEAEARSRSTIFEVNLEVGLPVLRGDAGQLQQVLLDLLRNAMEASEALPPASRVVAVRSQAAPGGVQICVTDRGAGVSLAHQPGLFSPFFTTKRDGLGLGLSVSHAIVSKHSGTLRYRSSPAGGACFEMALPSDSLQT